MNEGVSAELDWVDGSEEPGELVWTGDGWSFVDRPVASAVRRYGVLGGLDSQGCSISQTRFDLRQLFNIDECCQDMTSAQRADTDRLLETTAA